MAKYNHLDIEKKWQSIWDKTELYKTDEDPKKPKFYCLDMFPYPSGAGLHVGHPKGYIATDVYSRMKRLQGYKVLHPMGWDAFGLPTENYAIKNKINPKIAASENVKRFKEQLGIIGFSYDWNREINTTDPNYFKWTQWIFAKLFEKGLAYQSWEPINWCPNCKTGLSMEDLEAGKCERCGGEVEQKPMRQWVLKITDYADRLLEDLNLLDWEEQIIEQQRNWIGRSEGANVKFIVENKSDVVEVFTTRVDTIFGATFLVLAPEHPLVLDITTKDQKNEVDKYIKKTKKKTELQRMQEKTKTGTFTGAYAINPANGNKIPIWIADYVLLNYGTGAIMAVPAHDDRDNEFAKKYNLPIIDVIMPVEGEPHKDAEFRKTIAAVVHRKKDDKYLLVKWNKFGWISLPIGGIEEGESPEEAAERETLEETGYKAKAVKKLGSEIESHFFAANKNVWRHRLDQPVLLELIEDDQVERSEEEKKIGEPYWATAEEAIATMTHPYNAFGIARHIEQFIYTDGGKLINSDEFNSLTTEEAKNAIVAKLENDNLAKMAITYKMKDWVFSRQRYWGEPIPIIHCEKCGPVAVPESELPVTLPDVKSYEPTGTGESPLAKITDWVNVKCPKCGGDGKRETDTMPQWAGSSWYYLRFVDPKNEKQLIDPKKEKEWLPVDLYVGGIEHATRHLLYARFWHKFLFDIGTVSTPEPFKKLIHVGLILAEDGRKMSKRWNNVINPDDIVNEFGADSLRLYEMFMGPFTMAISWSTDGVKGARRFLDKVYDADQKYKKRGFSKNSSPKVAAALNKTIKKVTEDIEGFRFNTAVSAMMEFINLLNKDAKETAEASIIGQIETISKNDFELFLILLSPFAPHLAEELWHELGHETSIVTAIWPGFDPKLIVDEVITVAVQINGKVRDQLMVESGMEEENILAIAKDSAKVKKYLENTEISKVIYVKDKLLSIVTK